MVWLDRTGSRLDTVASQSSHVNSTNARVISAPDDTVLVTKALTSLYDDCHKGYYNRTSMSNTTSGLYGMPASSPRHINDQSPILVDTRTGGSQVNIPLWKGDVPLIVA